MFTVLLEVKIQILTTKYIKLQSNWSLRLNSVKVKQFQILTSI